MNISPYLKNLAERFKTEFTTIGTTPTGFLVNKHSPTTSIIFSFHSGVACEPEDLWGISHFTEHILLRGTEKFPTLYDISRQVERIGGQISAYSTRDMTSFWIKTPPGYEEHALDLMVEVLTKSSLKEEFIQSERLIIQQERQREINNPSLYSSLMIENLLLLPHPVSRHPVGEDRVINEMNSSTLGGYIKSVYHRNNMTVAAAGNISEEFIKKLASAIEKFPCGERLKEADFKIASNDEKIIHLPSHHKSQIHLSMGWKFPVKSRLEGLTWRILRTLLTSGYTSLLNNLLREKENITYLCSSLFNHYGGKGVFKINLALSDKNLKKAMELIDGFMEDLKGGKIPEELLYEAVLRHGTNVIFSLENSMEVAKIIGEYLTREDIKFSYHEYLAELEKINMSLLRELLETYLIESNKKILLLTGSDEVYKCFPDAFKLLTDH
jgi:predicted Zn-dependent peptidase